MQFLHMVGMVLHLMQDLLFVVLNVEVDAANIGYYDDENR